MLPRQTTLRFYGGSEAPLDPRQSVQCIHGLTYSEYLKSRHWQIVRHFAMQYYGWRCHDCSEMAKPNMRGLDYGRTHNVHHLNYRCLWKETPGDVVVLCLACHKRRHIMPDDNQGSKPG